MKFESFSNEEGEENVNNYTYKNTIIYENLFSLDNILMFIKL